MPEESAEPEQEAKRRSSEFAVAPGVGEAVGMKPAEEQNGGGRQDEDGQRDRKHGLIMHRRMQPDGA
jgi:hypothetical protein